MSVLSEWHVPFQVNTYDAEIGWQAALLVIGLANGWFLVSRFEPCGEGALEPSYVIAAKILNADGEVVYDSFTLNYQSVDGDQNDFDHAARHDGFVVVYGDQDFPGTAVRIERNLKDLSVLTGTLAGRGKFENPQIAANLLRDNDDFSWSKRSDRVTVWKRGSSTRMTLFPPSFRPSIRRRWRTDRG